jgi:hypothetical protein
MHAHIPPINAIAEKIRTALMASSIDASLPLTPTPPPGSWATGESGFNLDLCLDK